MRNSRRSEVHATFTCTTVVTEANKEHKRNKVNTSGAYMGLTV